LIVLCNNGTNKYFLTDEPPKTAKDKKALDYPRALITAISKKLIAWQDDVIRHSLKTKSCHAHISAGFRYSFHQKITLIHTPLDSSEGMLNDSFTLGTLIGFALPPVGKTRKSALSVGHLHSMLHPFSLRMINF
jgi:hypothetical protein